MEITAVKIRKTFDDRPLKAILSVTLDNCLAIHDVKIINAKGRLFVVMPCKKEPNGGYRDIVHPTNSQFRAIFEDTLIKEYAEYLSQKENLP